MAGVINKTERQIDIRVCLPSTLGGTRNVAKTLNPGFNVVDNQVWDEACKNKVVQNYLAGGALIGNARRTREDELVDLKLEQDRQAEINDLPRTPRAASVIEGDSQLADHVAVAHGAGAEGQDIIESGAADLSDDLLG